MQIGLVEKKQDRVSFSLKGVSLAFANGLRRAVIDEVPVMAIEDVEFEKNSSVLYDETVAHRLGLVPLTTDLKSYNLPNKCTCKGAGCAKCQLKVSLKAKAAGLVLSSEIKTKDPEVKPVFDEIPVAKLLKGQELELTAVAVLGKGKVHTKWSPGIATYMYVSAVNIKKEPENPEEVVQSCPHNILEIKNNKVVVNKEKVVECDACNACVDASKKFIEVVSDPNELIFTVESWGQLSPKEIMLRAADELIEKTEEFAEKIKDIK